jgi:hypothetical protein
LERALKIISRSLVVALVSAAGLAGCATPERFEWGSYDASLYAYSRHADHLPQYERALQDAIAHGKAAGRLAPGLQAELGYCYLGEGKKAEAVAEFNAEMASFPESRLFMTRIIAQVQGS